MATAGLKKYWVRQGMITNLYSMHDKCMVQIHDAGNEAEREHWEDLLDEVDYCMGACYGGKATWPDILRIRKISLDRDEMRVQRAIESGLSEQQAAYGRLS